MRLDKFLKVSRIIKRRTVAKEICAGGRVLLNGKTAKAGTEVNPGDRLRIELGKRTMKVTVKKTPSSIRAEDAPTMYEVVSVTEKNSDDFF